MIEFLVPLIVWANAYAAVAHCGVHPPIYVIDHAIPGMVRVQLVGQAGQLECAEQALRKEAVR